MLREPDDLSAGDLVDHIEDAAGQKGTGRWASIESLEQGVDLSMITGAVDARILSGHQDERRLADLGAPEAQQISDRHSFVETVRQGLYLGKIAAYAQGFALMHNASKQYGWNLNLGAIASIFRAGRRAPRRFPPRQSISKAPRSAFRSLPLFFPDPARRNPKAPWRIPFQRARGPPPSNRISSPPAPPPASEAPPPRPAPGW